MFSQQKYNFFPHITTISCNFFPLCVSVAESEGFNRLFKAQRYGKWFVLKGLKPEHQNKEVYLSLLTKEFELGVQMDHPNIVHKCTLPDREKRYRNAEEVQ